MENHPVKTIKAAALGFVLSALATSALAAEPAKCCCCKEKAEKMTCCDKPDGAKPNAEPAEPAHPDGQQQHQH